MAKKRTVKSCYESVYGGEWITASQKLAEMACERIAGTNTLGALFWRNKTWEGVYRREITHATELLKTFVFEAITRAWHSQEGRRVKRLGAPFFRPMIEIAQRQINLEKQLLDKAPIPEQINTLETPRPIKRAGRSMREKLQENGENQNSLFNGEADIN